MKKFKYAYIGMAMLAAVGMASCQANMDAPEMEVPVATMTPNTTLSELKTLFGDQTAMICPMKDEDSKMPYIIHGRVISSDASGNIYKSIVIQDETAALAISINQSSTYNDYRIGQEIVMDVTGLWIGQYRGLIQLGTLGTPYDGLPQLNFMPWDEFLMHTQKNGLPDPTTRYVGMNDEWPSDNVYCIVTEIGKLPTSGEDFRNIQSQLVEFRNVSFVDGGNEIFAPYQESVSRTLRDANGAEIIVRNSGYSNFYNDTIPAGSGTVRGILSYYGSDWQILLRTRDDVIFDSKGSKDDPYTVAEAIEKQDQGYAGWMKGYIVGSVKGGVAEVTSNSDIIFGADAEMDNNLVVGPAADCTDWTQCVAVQLPQGSDLRKYGNLADNPAVYKKSILISGGFSKYLGMAGLTGNTGSADAFEIDGVVIDGPDVPGDNGDGSKENPYSITQVMNSTADVEGVWIEGYVVGYVPDMQWSTAVFGNTPTEGSTNYSNATNCILSTVAPPNANSSNSVPAGLSNTGNVRATLGISKNPSIYGKKVKVKGDVTKYFGVRGIKNISDFEVDGGGGETPDNPPVTPPETGGDGTEANPYTVAQVMSSTSDSTGSWVVGYVVGYVSGMNWQETAVFGTTPTEGSTNYTNATNCILSDVDPAGANFDNSIPAGLKNTGTVRSTLGISKNPSIYGKKVKVKGEITKYFGVRAIKNIEDYKLLD